MAEDDSDWYFGSRLSLNEDSSTVTEKSSSVYHGDNEDSESETCEPFTQVDCARSSSSSLGSDDFSDEESYSSSEESVIDLEKLRREQIRLTFLKEESKNRSPEFKGEKVNESNSHIPMFTTISDYSNDEEKQTPSYLKSQPCPLDVPHKLAVQMLKINKHKPSIKEFAPPVSQALDGSAYIPEIRRTKLPIETRRDDIINIIRENRVIVLSGSTGCGKVNE
jgi:hypothetical protein